MLRKYIINIIDTVTPMVYGSACAEYIMFSHEKEIKKVANSWSNFLCVALSNNFPTKKNTNIIDKTPKKQEGSLPKTILVW